MWKKIGIGLLVALVLVGGISGAVYAAKVIDESDGPIGDLFDRLARRLGLSREDMLQQLLDGKTLDEVMEDQGITRDDVMGDWQVCLVRKPLPPFFRMADIAGVLGMEPADLQQAFADGQSLADVIESQGLDKEDIVQDLIAFSADKIKAAQEAGDITDAQAEKLLERLENTDIGTDWMDKVPVSPTIRERLLDRVKAHPRIIFDDLAAALGMEPADLRAAFAEGQTLSEIIEAQGLDEEQVFEDVKASIVSGYEGVVEDKAQALEQAEQLLEKLKSGDFGKEMWDRFLDWEGPLPRRNALPWRVPRYRRQ